MKYNLLKINNISKICDDTIYTDQDGNIIPLQWFDFQLDFIFEKKGLSTYNEITGLKYTRNQMRNLLNEIFNNHVILDDNIAPDVLYSYGLLPVKINNEFNISNLGGIMRFTPALNEYSNSVAKPAEQPFFSMSIHDTSEYKPPDRIPVNVTDIVEPPAKKPIKLIIKKIKINRELGETTIKNVDDKKQKIKAKISELISNIKKRP